MAASRLSSTDGRDAGPRGRGRGYQHRSRRRVASRGSRGAWCSSPTRSPASGSWRGSPTTTKPRFLARRDRARARAEPAPAPARLAEASVDRDPAVRPGGADFGHIDLGPPARAEAPGAHRRAQPAWRGSSARSRSRRSPDRADGTGWRTRVRLHVADDGGLGPYAARSHRVIPVAGLPLATAAVRERRPARASGSPGSGRRRRASRRASGGRGSSSARRKPSVIREMRRRSGVPRRRHGLLAGAHGRGARPSRRAVQDAIDHDAVRPEGREPRPLRRRRAAGRGASATGSARPRA